MNRERAKELLPIITAFANGEAIQGRNTNPVGSCWCDLVDEFIAFENMAFKFRIKPSLREFWVNPKTMTVWSTEGSDNNCIKVREVLNDG